MSEKFLVETSARHVHVTQQMLEKLFGEGYQLTVKKYLSQPGQFASNEKVVIRGPRGELKASILGPVRDHNQVEISLTEARQLGIAAPVRESGHIEGTPGCTLVGPAGEAELEQGVIAAKRHVHMTPQDAEHYGVHDGQIVSVRVHGSNDRDLTFADTVIRVSPKFTLAMHIDTDESNAAGTPTEGEIVG
jgi:putative phosphotransacetylase